MRNLLQAEFYKLRVSTIFRGFIIANVLSAVISVLFVNTIGAFTVEAPQELLDQMLFNGVYNFGFIQVNNLSDLIDMSSFFVVSSAFKNYSPIILAAVFISVYLKSEFINGGIRNFLFKGFGRNQIVFSKYIAIITALVFMLCSYFFSYCISSILIFGNLLLSVTLILDITAFLLIEIFLIISFASICFATVIFSQRHTIVLLNASMVVVSGMVINVMMIVTNGQFDLSKFWILDYVIRLTPGEYSDYLVLLFIGIITIIISFISATMRFKYIEFK